MHTPLSEAALQQLFLEARTYPAWQDRPVTDEQIRAIYELARWAPTAMNNNPMRLIAVKSEEAKEKLRPALAEGNVAKVMSAPVTFIIAQDLAFYEKLPVLFPASPGARDNFAANPPAAERQAFINATLQGAYMILAARALGLDCGPMAGFSNDKVDEAFFAGTTIRSNFLLNVGYGDAARLHPRGPRLSFEEIGQIL